VPPKHDGVMESGVFKSVNGHWLPLLKGAISHFPSLILLKMSWINWLHILSRDMDLKENSLLDLLSITRIAVSCHPGSLPHDFASSIHLASVSECDFVGRISLKFRGRNCQDDYWVWSPLCHLESSRLGRATGWNETTETKPSYCQSPSHF
jgi:hypothetical protein